MTFARKRVLLILGIVLALPVLAFIGEHYRSNRALAKYKRELVAKGEKLTVAECRAAPPDAAENGFEEFLGATALMDNRSFSQLAPPMLRVVAPGKVQALWNLAEWPLRLGPQWRLTNGNWQLLEEAMAGSRESFEAARAALRKPRFYDASCFAHALPRQPPRLGKVRTAAFCFNADIPVRLHRGQLEEALGDLETVLQLSRAMGKHPTFFAQVVRSSVAGAVIGATWQALQTPGWSDAQLARMQHAWEENDFVGPAVEVLEMQRALDLEFIQQMRESNKLAADTMGSFDYLGNGSTKLDEFAQQARKRGGKLLFRGLYVPFWQFARCSSDEQDYLRMMQQLLNSARSVRVEPVMKPTLAVINQLEFQGFFAELFGMSRAQGFERAATIQAERDLAIVAIALKRYQLKHLRLPPDLVALVPEFLPAPPRDIFDGQPMRYRPKESGFLLYSIGRNERDEGGNMTGGPSGIASFFSGQDIVWPQPATEEEVKAADEKDASKRGPRGPRRP